MPHVMFYINNPIGRWLTIYTYLQTIQLACAQCRICIYMINGLVENNTRGLLSVR